ncbi:phosphatidate cytidylyltransferase [Anaeropeptidivorans aminofermentans]|uniref:phosphatidate cytidylyltransferase n=1 Tax=Anaeropeptidivorans aminofermentans TaxID=2934315 RepID=UPI002024A94D|nr:phosphatidate cytidylyltransferase [Anaeropeptidivorans aminofermentans]
MLKRIVTSIIGLPIVVLIIAYGGLPMKLLMVLISAIGMFEFYRAFNRGTKIENYISYLFIAIYYAFIDRLNSDILLMMLFSYMLLNLAFLVLNHSKMTPFDAAINVFGFLYIGFLLSSIYLTRVHPYGRFLVWLIFTSAWGSDTFAYFTGITIGKHQFTPILSPKKTIEGVIGGILGAMLIGFLYAFVLTKTTNIGNEINAITLFVIMSGFGAAFSVLGDLTASAIKRYTKIKDYGKLIPGHGGIMDRFDSIIFTAPVVYMVLRLILIYK